MANERFFIWGKTLPDPDLDYYHDILKPLVRSQPAAKNDQKYEKVVSNKKITKSFVLDPSGVANERFFIWTQTLPDHDLDY